MYINKRKMHTPVKILIDKNNNDNKIVDKFDLYQGNYDSKRHCLNKFISCVYKTNKFAWICNLNPQEIRNAKLWIKEKSNKNDDSILIELTHEECESSLEKRQEIANNNTKNINEMHYVQQSTFSKETCDDDTWTGYGYNK